MELSTAKVDGWARLRGAGLAGRALVSRPSIRGPRCLDMARLRSGAKRCEFPVLGLRVETFDASTESEIEPAVAGLSARKLGALLVANHPLFTTHREHLVALAARYAMPTMYVQREFAAAGNLISYGTDLPDVYRQAGVYAGDAGGLMAYTVDLAELLRHLARDVHEILNGAKPGDIPIYQATRFELLINLRTAKALGLTLPPTLLSRADEIID